MSSFVRLSGKRVAPCGANDCGCGCGSSGKRLGAVCQSRRLGLIGSMAVSKLSVNQRQSLFSFKLFVWWRVL